MDNTFLKKITLLNEATLESLEEKDNLKVIKNFTEAGINTLEADFGFAWWKMSENEEYKLVYKSPGTPYEPTTPRKNAGNYIARKTKKPFFDEDVKRKNYDFDITRYLKSYIIVPICYHDTVYGSLVLCYRDKHIFSEEELGLASSLGNVAAQTITIHHFIENEHKARLQAEKNKTELLNSEMRFRRLFETAQDGILLVGIKTGQINEVNQNLLKILQYEREELIGKNFCGIGIFENENLCKGIFKTMQNEDVRYDELQVKRKDGTLLKVEFVSSLYKIDHSDVVQCNIRDITERKRIEEITENKRQLNEERMKAEFIADATHELRTPLAIIRGNVDLAMMKEPKMPSTFITTFRAINHEISHLSELLSDLTLLTSNKVELNRRLSSEKINIKKNITHVAETCKKLAYKKKITITIKDLPEVNIMGDKIYIEKLFNNIIKNAITYGRERGSIIVNGSKKSNFVDISITDNGIGISKNDLPYVFERFFRSDRSHARTGRTGLGLSICKWIVESHGGSINVQSIEGKGSTFTVSLPTL